MQTLARDNCARLEKFIPELHKAVIIDEAHHAASPSYIEILSRFDSEIEKRFEGEVSETGRPQELIKASRITSKDEVDALQAAAAAQIEADEGAEPLPEEEEEVDDVLETASSPEVAAGASSPMPIPVSDPDPVPLKLDSLGRARVPLIAFTATWGRADGIALGKVFEKIVWHGEWLDMIRGKWCVNPPARSSSSASDALREQALAAAVHDRQARRAPQPRRGRRLAPDRRLQPRQSRKRHEQVRGERLCDRRVV